MAAAASSINIGRVIAIATILRAPRSLGGTSSVKQELEVLIVLAINVIAPLLSTRSLAGQMPISDRDTVLTLTGTLRQKRHLHSRRGSDSLRAIAQSTIRSLPNFPQNCAHRVIYYVRNSSGSDFSFALQGSGIAPASSVATKITRRATGLESARRDCSSCCRESSTAFAGLE
jgi:hypothetical protein